MDYNICAKLFKDLPQFKRILEESDSLETARDRLLVELERLVETNVDDVLNLSGLQFSLRLSCARAFRQFLCKRSIKLTGFDLLKVLWHIARNEFDLIEQPVSPAFVEDVARIFAGISGNAGIYDVSETELEKGRQAALHRSQSLNEIFEKSENEIHKYSSGLDPERIEERHKNKIRIMKFFNCSDAEFSSHEWQLDHIVRNSETLEQLVELNAEEKKSIDLAKQAGLPFGITPYYATLFCEKPDTGIDQAIRAQVIPPLKYVEAMIEGLNNRKEKFDFMREADTSPIDLITRRYPRIAILKPYNTCSQICVYCQRNWEIDDAYIPQAFASETKIEEAIQWIENTPSLSEILVTGGDPLVMPDNYIKRILNRLASIKNIRRIRFGTRTPVVLPQRFTDELLEIFALHHIPGQREICFVTHFEHSLEVTPEAMEAVQKIRKGGMGVYNQAVFTFYNSRRFELAALRKWLRLIGVEPYYSFNAKGKKETASYRVPIARLQQEAKEEARLLPGMERTDEPVFNVPGLGKNYLRAEQNHLLLTILPDGSRVYEFHPWEKFIKHAKSYIHIDVPILDYLKRLENVGEKIEDYKTIFYYF
ncbi:MAG: KamA family radical SAM protein [Candidatus Rifleibacteriota bacterium]